MFCPHCGVAQTLTSPYCPQCGTPQGMSPQAMLSTSTTGGSTWSLTRLGLVETLLLPMHELAVDAPHFLGIGLLISMIPLLGSIFLLGYALRWTQGLLRGQRYLPRWDGWWDLFWEGGWSSLVASAFALVPLTGLTLWWTVRVLEIFTQKTGPKGPIVDVESLLWGLAQGTLYGFLVTVLCSLPAPLAVVAYAREGRVLAALSPSRWAPVMARGLGSFLVCWLLVCASSGAAGLASLLALGIPLIGVLASWVVSGALGLVVLLGGHAVFARYYLLYAPEP